VVEPEPTLKFEYETLVAGHDRITDFRAKLLGFLPLGSTVAIGVLTAVRDDAPLLRDYFWAVGAFGFVVTVGLYFFEWHQMKHCGAIIARARVIERKLRFETGGFFTIRPDSWVDAHTAGYIVYGIVATAWASVVVVSRSGVLSDVLGWVLIAILATLICAGLGKEFLRFHRMRRRRPRPTRV
jgi:hypothetical protein